MAHPHLIPAYTFLFRLCHLSTPQDFRSHRLSSFPSVRAVSIRLSIKADRPIIMSATATDSSSLLRLPRSHAEILHSDADALTIWLLADRPARVPVTSRSVGAVVQPSADRALADTRAQDPQFARLTCRAAILRSSCTTSRAQAAAQGSSRLGVPFRLGTMPAPQS